MHVFSENYMERYKRQTILEEVGLAGQKKLLNAKVLIVGVGGLGSPAALYLAGSGIGTLGLVDHDKVALSNLQRQIIHNVADLNRSKTVSASNKILALNPDIHVIQYVERLTENNIDQIVQEYDFIIEATDNFQTKLLINQTCCRLKKTLSEGI